MDATGIQVLWVVASPAPIFSLLGVVWADGDGCEDKHGVRGNLTKCAHIRAVNIPRLQKPHGPRSLPPSPPGPGLFFLCERSSLTTEGPGPRLLSAQLTLASFLPSEANLPRTGYARKRAGHDIRQVGGHWERNSQTQVRVSCPLAHC